MAHKFNREVEIRSALLHLHSIVTHKAVGRESERSQEAIDRLAADLGDVYGVDFSDLENSESYGEIEYLRWAMTGCQNLLGHNSDDEMEEAIKLDDEEHMTVEQKFALIEALPKRDTFGPIYSETRNLHGQPFEILRRATAEEADLEEVGPMHRIRLSDGTEVTAWPEEIFEGAAKGAAKS